MLVLLRCPQLLALRDCAGFTSSRSAALSLLHDRLVTDVHQVNSQINSWPEALIGRHSIQTPAGRYPMPLMRKFILRLSSNYYPQHAPHMLKP